MEKRPMNAAITTYTDNDFDYKVDFRENATGDPPARSGKAAYGRRRGKRPESYNGMHRRRKRRIKW